MVASDVRRRLRAAVRGLGPVLALLAAAALSPGGAMAQTEEEFSWERLPLPDGRVMEYALGLPDDLDPEQTYPALLALPPGAQDKAMAAVSMDVVGNALRRRGWIVISPVAPNRELFFQGSERYLPHLLDEIVGKYNIRDRKFHFFGISNGGISAFRLATLLPVAVASITVAPGYPSPPDFRRLGNITHVPVTLFVGAMDGRWVTNAESTYGTLKRLNADVTLEVVPGVGHSVFHEVGTERLIEAIERR